MMELAFQLRAEKNRNVELFAENLRLHRRIGELELRLAAWPISAHLARDFVRDATLGAVNFERRRERPLPWWFRMFA